jgi:hypothetical protein
MTTRRGEALVGNAADEEQLDQATQKIAVRDEIERADIRKVLATPEGRRELWRLLTSCGVHRSSFAGEAALTTAFNEGERNVGLRAEARAMKHAPEFYIQMRNEAAQESL